MVYGLGGGGGPIRTEVAEPVHPGLDLGADRAAVALA